MPPIDIKDRFVDISFCSIIVVIVVCFDVNRSMPVRLFGFLLFELSSVLALNASLSTQPGGNHDRYCWNIFTGKV